MKKTYRKQELITVCLLKRSVSEWHIMKTMTLILAMCVDFVINGKQVMKTGENYGVAKNVEEYSVLVALQISME